MFKINNTMLFSKINHSFLVLIVFIIINNIFYIKNSLSSNFKDCKDKAYYITNIKSDITSQNIQKAKTIAENNAKSIAFKKIFERLVLNPKNEKKFKIDLKNLINFIKINQEASSIKRFVGSFDVCFNKSETTKLFEKNNLSYSEIFSVPISVLPIYGSPRGYVFFDDKNFWQILWTKEIESYNGLLNLKISKGNIFLKRKLKAKKILSSESSEILKILKYDKTKRLITIVAEPVLLKNGNFALKTFAKLYDKKGEFIANIYSNIKNFKNYENVQKNEKRYLEKEVKNIIYIYSESWKKSNLFKKDVLTHIDLYVPINKENNWSNFISLVDKIPYINDFIIVAIRNDVGKVRIQFQGTVDTLFSIFNEKGLKFKKVKDEFILLSTD